MAAPILKREVACPLNPSQLHAFNYFFHKLLKLLNIPKLKGYFQLLLFKKWIMHDLHIEREKGVSQEKKMRKKPAPLSKRIKNAGMREVGIKMPN